MNRITNLDIQRNLFDGPFHLVSNKAAYHGKQFADESQASEFITQVHLREIKNAILDFMILIKQKMQVNYIPADNASITAISSIEASLSQIDASDMQKVREVVNDLYNAWMPHFMSGKKASKLWPAEISKLNDCIGVVRSFVIRYSALAV